MPPISPIGNIGQGLPNRTPCPTIFFTLGYQKFSIFVCILNSSVARKGIQATKNNKVLSTPVVI